MTNLDSSILALYEMQPIGSDKGLEATSVFYFCSKGCSEQFKKNRNPTDAPLKPGLAMDFEAGTVCDQCDRAAEIHPKFSNLPICCGDAVVSETARFRAEGVKQTLEGEVVECPRCERGIIYRFATGWRRYWKPCDICDNDTSHERHNEAEPPEGSFCQDCGNWVCPDCEGGMHGDGEGVRMVCKRCSVHQ